MKKLIKTKRNYISAILVIILTMCASAAAVNAQAKSKSQSAEGAGALINADGSRSLFSFKVKTNPNGKVIGQADLRNPSFKAGSGQDKMLKIDLVCFRVEGNRAILGGLTKRAGNQPEQTAIYFAVEDGGAGGADKIFRGFFFSDDAAKKGDPNLCRTLEREVPVFEPIAEGEIIVNGE